MPQRVYTISMVSGFRISRRGIAFLEASDGSLDARHVFEGLTVKRKREVSSRFDHWLDGNVYDKYFHGWPNLRDYKECFVFRWKENRDCHRLYGFLCHPRPKTDRPFRLCVLSSHAVKTEWETDPAELENVRLLQQDDSVIMAIRQIFPEYGVD